MSNYKAAHDIQTWQEAAEAWREGGSVWSAELGGIGPGYEQAIQVLLFEILARWEGDPPISTGKAYDQRYASHVDKVVHDLDKECGGFSGAQVGAAKATAFQFMVYGYKHMMDKLSEDRKILVGKSFPRPQ